MWSLIGAELETILGSYLHIFRAREQVLMVGQTGLPLLGLCSHSA